MEIIYNFLLPNRLKDLREAWEKKKHQSFSTRCPIVATIKWESWRILDY